MIELKERVITLLRSAGGSRVQFVSGTVCIAGFAMNPRMGPIRYFSNLKNHGDVPNSSLQLADWFAIREQELLTILE